MHPIQVVARLTGLSPHVIRVWEKRHRAVTPQRTGSNRRCYTDSEVERLRWLARVTAAGHGIGTVARLSVEDLRRLATTVDASSEPKARSVPKRTPVTEVDAGPQANPGARRSEVADLLAAAIAAVRGFRSAELRETLELGAVELGANGVLHRLVHPLACEMGRLWEQGHLTAAQEHFASAVIRDLLLGGAGSYAVGAEAPLALVTTPAGQMHELGAVMAAAAAVNSGWRAVYLGPSLPAVEIAGAAVQSRAKAVLLSVVYPSDDPHLGGELVQLRRLLPLETSVVVGGRAATAYRAALAEIGALTPSGLEGLLAVLEELRRGAQMPQSQRLIHAVRSEPREDGDLEGTGL